MSRMAALVSLLGLSLLSLTAPTSLEAAFAFRKPLVVRGARIVGGAHADFPVLVSLVDPNLRSTAFGGNVRNANGYDLEFRANDLVTIVDHEVERYDPATGTLVAWVRLPGITNGTDVTVHLYYGDPGVTCARNNPARVWNSGYRYVYHLAESGAANPADSTANAVPAVRNPTVDAGIVNAFSAGGWIAGALDLQGGPVVPPASQFQLTTPTHLRITDGALAANPAMTMEVWFRADTKANGAFYGLHVKGRESGTDWIGSYMLPSGANHRFGLGWQLPAGNVTAVPNLNTAQWYHGVVTSTGGAMPTRTAYLDGTQIATSAVAAALASIAAPTRVGDDSNGTYLDGQVDEVRFSNVTRSAAWIQTTFQNHRCPSLSTFPAGCAAGTHFVDDSGAQVAAGLPLFNNATAGSGLNTGGAKDGGLAWQDWNGDGCLDVLVNSDDAVVASRLYLQDKSSTCTGTFTDVTSCIAAGLLISPLERAALWGDLNNDGRPDFVRDDNLSLEVYLNNGPGLTTGGSCPATGIAWSRFGNPLTGTASQTIDGAVIPGFNGEGLGLLDYDADGDLDLVVDNADGGFLMLRNNGAGVLTSVAGTGLPAASGGNGDYLAVGDFDVDGDVDIFARREDGATVWVNNGGTFALNLNSPEVAINANKGGVAMCDLDNDGDLDFVWTDGLNGIAGSAGAEAWRNNGPGGTATTWTNFPLTFVPAPAGGQIVDGVSCGDVDNDGDLDLAFTNGGNDYLFRNDGAFTFVNITPGAFGGTDGEGNGFGDHDRDGDLDLLVNQATANEHWRNETGGNNYLMVRPLHDLDGAGPGTATRDAIGATVSLRSCSGTLLTGVREVNGGTGMGGQGTFPVHFGLPTTGSPRGPNMVYVVRVQYVGGTVRQKAVVPAALGCYQEVAIANTDADDTAACVATAVELSSFAARACDGAVDVRWTTASEVDNLGFHLHRALRPEGPYERLTPALIPGLGSSPTGAAYRHLDVPVANGTTLFYELEDVDTSGQATRHGPVTATPGPGAVCDGGRGGEDGGPGGGDDGSPREPGSRGWLRYGEPGDPRLTVLERGPGYVVLDLFTPGFDALPDEAGGVLLAVPGFEEPSEPGAPLVPLRRAVVAAEAGRKVRLTSIAAEDTLAFDGIRLSTVGRPGIEVGEAGVVRPERRRSGTAEGGTGFYPRVRARLSGTHFQEETKKAEVTLHPLRYDPQAGRLVLYRRLRVRLSFAGSEPREVSLGGARGRSRPAGAGAKKRGVVARFVTGEEGLYRVSFEEALGARGRGVRASSLRLSRRGEAVPIRVEPPGSSFGPGSSLYFLGGGDANPYGEAVYELELGPGGLMMPEVDSTPAGGPVSEIVTERHFEENRFYQAALLEAPDLWLWDLVISPGSKSFPFSLPALAGGSSRAGRVIVRVQGASDFESASDHHVRVVLNGQAMAEATWAGKTERVIEGEIPPGLLREDGNTLTLENVADTGAAYSMVFLNRFTVSYPRRLLAEAGAIAGRADETGTVEVQGLSGEAFVLDTTGSPAWVRGTVASPMGLRLRVGAGRDYRVIGESAVRRPEVRRASPPSLLAASNRADWLLIAPREMLRAAAPLVAWRREQGLRAKAVALEDVYAGFGHGEAHPDAIRAFLSYTWEFWKRPSPRYVVLLGDSTYDPRDHLGTGIPDRIPSPLLRTTFLWAPSDPSLAAVNGDDLVPDLAVGRLPARDVAEAEALVQKVLAFETSGVGLEGTAVLVADNPDAGGDFEADAEDIASTVLAGRPRERLFVRELGVTTRDAIRASLDRGPALVSYMGHGGTAVWASENVWNNLDLAGLAPQVRPHLLLAMNCLNGFFHFPSLDALGEAFLKAEGRGAIAVFAPSGLSVNAAAHVYHRALLAEIESGRHRRLGDALLAAQAEYADEGGLPELLGIYHLFGDPALRIQ